jgi:hypothetical protein
MPLYGVAQSGFNGPPSQGLNIASLIPGESITLFSPSDPAGVNQKSVAFARGYSPSAMDNGITFNLSGIPSAMTVDVQCAGADIDGDYYTVATLSGDTNGNTAYTDTGRSPFYRLQVSAYTSGVMPTATANR